MKHRDIIEVLKTGGINLGKLLESDAENSPSSSKYVSDLEVLDDKVMAR